MNSKGVKIQGPVKIQRTGENNLDLDFCKNHLQNFAALLLFTVDLDVQES